MKSKSAVRLLASTCALGLLGAAGGAQAQADSTKTLTVCADPGNMPLSSREQAGFEQKIAPLIATAMGASLHWEWWPTIGHGMMRKTIGSGLCDVWMDMPPGVEGAETTLPLYRSTFVLATPSHRRLRIKNFDDPTLARLKRIGVYETSSIREALAEHSILGNTIIQYVTYDTATNPKDQPSYQVQQVIDGQLDAAATWGPLAGYYKTVLHAPLDIQPTNLWSDDIPLQAEMALAVARGHADLKTALDQAMRAKKDEIRQVLIDYGVPLVECKECIISGDLPAHPPYSGKFSVTDSAAAGGGVSLAELKHWLAQGADPNLELDDAIIANDPVRVRYLLAHGAAVNAPNGNGYTPLVDATRFGFDQIATCLAGHGADVNRADASGWNPLHYAAWTDNDALVRALVAQGAKVNAQDPKGMTPLVIAAQYGKAKAAEALIAAGADVNQRIGEGGYTPLMLATLSGSQSIVERLLAHGADVNIANPAGVTALMVAAAHQEPDIAKLLLGRGADLNARTADGRTALSIAKESGNDALVQLLQDSAGNHSG
ncbi:MAG: ankyrin repeat domain-containing protein [Gammaproteobacteria bacterium]|nr:ankyrin repeat domain-containing protein [Gammaproteobacteria bacterium]